MNAEEYLLSKGWIKHANDYWSIDDCPSMSMRDALDLQKEADG